MENHKPNLNETPQDPDAELVRLGLEELMLQKKVASVAVERKRLIRQRFWRRAMLAGMVMLTAYGVFKIFSAPQPVQEPLQQGNPSMPVPDTTSIPKQLKQEPIAQIKPSPNIPAPRFPSPNVRGENQENPARKALLDQIWYTEYPPAGIALNDRFAPAGALLKSRDFNSAYVQLQRIERKLPENDTLSLLKGYCLLEMGEGAEALVYFQRIQGNPAAWAPALQWYQGLGYLLTDDRVNAVKTFRTISNTAKHPYQDQSKKAIQLLTGK